MLPLYVSVSEYKSILSQSLSACLFIISSIWVRSLLQSTADHQSSSTASALPVHNCLALWPSAIPVSFLQSPGHLVPLSHQPWQVLFSLCNSLPQQNESRMFKVNTVQRVYILCMQLNTISLMVLHLALRYLLQHSSHHHTLSFQMFTWPSKPTQTLDRKWL